MRKIICAANWKLNKNPQETLDFLNEFLENISVDEQENFVIFAPTINLTTVSEKLNETKVGWGAQNTYFADNGAFTGENSAQVVKSLGATHSLVGHSERRQIFHESNEEVNKKIINLVGHGLVPVFCIGETLEEREKDQTLNVIDEQIKVGLKDFDFEKPIILAYEPVWAIGTGKVATPQQAQEVHQHIRNLLSELCGEEKAQKIHILYGGSVKPENSKELFAKEDIDGFLIGGASLKVESFTEVLRQAQS